MGIRSTIGARHFFIPGLPDGLHTLPMNLEPRRTFDSFPPALERCRIGAVLFFSLSLILACTAGAQDAPRQKTAEEILPLVNDYCGACHAVPRPDVLPKRSWPAVINAMVGISQERRGRAFLTKEQVSDIIAFYYGSSPEELPLLPHIEQAPASLRFVAREIGMRSPLPFVTNVTASKITTSKDVELLVGDGEAKKLFLLTRGDKAWKERALADIEIPVHTDLVDMDDDGDLDILVADLGQFPPLDALAGKLYLLRQASPGVFEKELLQENLGRVSDVRALDLDADGDLDVAVAVFGGGDVGEVFWLENTGGEDHATRYKKHLLSDLSGAINISPADLNGDGRMDLMTLFAQEHEMIMAFVNMGEGTFESGVIARAPHPMYGSTSLTPVDLDRDGDIDLLFTNGDAFDAQTDPKPYHGLQWLENKGELKFAFHPIGRFYGAATAAAGDLDNDGDIDIVAGSWVNFWNDPNRAAIVWYENDGQQNFKAHRVTDRPAGIASIQLADVTGDGMLDIIAGALRMDLLLAKLGSPYKAARLFPSAKPGTKHPRVIVLENTYRGKK